MINILYGFDDLQLSLQLTLPQEDLAGVTTSSDCSFLPHVQFLQAERLPSRSNSQSSTIFILILLYFIFILLYSFDNFTTK